MKKSLIIKRGLKMVKNQDEVLKYIIEIKTNIAKIEEHLKTLNGSVIRHQKELDTRQKASENNTSEIGVIKLKMAKWAGGAVVIMAIINMVIARIF